MSNDRIPEDLKKAIKNRKGIKFKKKISEIILGGAANKKKKEEKDKLTTKEKKIKKDIDTTMELIKTPEFEGKGKDAFKLATKLDKPVPGGIAGSLQKQSMKNRFLKKPSKPIFRDPDIMVRPAPFEAELDPRRKNMGGKLTKTKPVTMNMGGQVDGVEDLTTEIEVID
tara:strand:+ start:127 stop:633 length:507 start_codon:yes stop_codon:yes gene_type:complete